MRADLNLAAFQSLLTSPGLQAVSFDVFDTAVVRTFARPTDLFFDLGRRFAERGLLVLPPSRFSHLRVQAEAQARSLRIDGEPQLTEIYEALATRLGWGALARKMAENMELALESEALRAVPQFREWIQAARAAGKRIAFVSDMYLPAAMVREVLVRERLAEPADLVLVSCEERVTKYQGALFDRLLQQLGAAPHAVLHVGDNFHSDGRMPRAKGMQSLLVQNTHLSFFEQRALSYQHDTAQLSGRLAATSRLARLACVPQCAHPALSEVGAGLLGPWLVCFALWTFQRAKRAGINRLYYVSRDGQVMREIALAVQARWPEAAGIECRYLHGSRVAWHQAAMTNLGDHQLRWLLNPQPRVNAEILADRLGIPGEKLTALLAGTAAGGLLELPAWTAAEIGCVGTVLRGKAAEILGLPEVAARRALGRQYLEQEGLLQDSTWAIVELGWTGSMMVSLHEALGRPAKLTAYYLNLIRLNPDLPEAVHLESFAINPEDMSEHLGKGLRFAEMIEVLTAADHGTVLGYEQVTNRVQARLKTDSPLIWPLPVLQALRAGAQAFAAQMPAEVMTQLAAQLAHDSSARIVAHQLLLVLADFMREPPPELARAFTGCQFTEDPIDHDQRHFVQPLSLWPLMRSGWDTERELWAQGSLAVSSTLSKAYVRGGVSGVVAQLGHGLLRRGRAASRR